MAFTNKTVHTRRVSIHVDYEIAINIAWSSEYCQKITIKTARTRKTMDTLHQPTEPAADAAALHKPRPFSDVSANVNNSGNTIKTPNKYVYDYQFISL